MISASFLSLFNTFIVSIYNVCCMEMLHIVTVVYKREINKKASLVVMTKVAAPTREINPAASLVLSVRLSPSPPLSLALHRW